MNSCFSRDFKIPPLIKKTAIYFNCLGGLKIPEKEGFTMDMNRFGEQSPGEVIGIGSGEYAFIPQPLPPNWAFPPELWPLLAEAKQSDWDSGGAWPKFAEPSNFIATVGGP